jgi:hypothetical protein
MTVKERLHRLVDELTEGELQTAVRMLEGLHAARTSQQSLDDGFEVLRARLSEQGLSLTPPRPSAERWAEPLPDLPDVDLSGAVVEEREEALRRWD